ncbi:regulator of (H+)-ATPase in vacuolar membrane [Ascosphaera atra]|nr:regulator of (H+)-ATPase in vacuolar membrane [Ascosphaera atra]
MFFPRLLKTSPIQGLLSSFSGGEIPTQDTPLHSKSYLSNDPALSIIYQQLREKTLQTIKGAEHVPGKQEWDFVLRNARLYARMGCDLLALDLVRQWTFIPPPPPPPKQPPETQPPENLRHELRHSLIRRRSSLTVADMPPAKDVENEPSKATPTMFTEPDANSLLDSFGF